MKRTKILLLLTSQEYIRNLISSGAVDQLISHNDVHVILPENLVLKPLESSKFAEVHRYSGNAILEKKGTMVFEITARRWRKKSSSFEFRELSQNPPMFYVLVRILRHRRNLRNIRESSSTESPTSQSVHSPVNESSENPNQPKGRLSSLIRQAISLLRIAISVYKMHLRKRCYRILAGRLIFPYFVKLYVDKMKINQSLSNEIVNCSPDMVIYPSSAYETTAIDLVKICSNSGIISLFLIDNWDNLSSKSILWEKPDHVGTWGEQSSDHALEIQGFRKEQVSSIGSPRFQQYFDLRNSQLKSPFDFPYALFVGTALAFEEAKALRMLDEEIEANLSLYRGLRIVYRPHPSRQGNDSIGTHILKNVLVDPQVSDNYFHKQSDSSVGRFVPDINYYPALILNAHFVVGGLTSMLIESSILRRRYLALVHREKFSVTSPSEVYRMYTHFQGLDRLPNVRFCKKESLIPMYFRELFLDNSEVDQMCLDQALEYFIHSDRHSYSFRLNALATGIMQQNHERL